MIDLSIIIVNYKSALLIVDCLTSALKNTPEMNWEWIVVDNDSRDNSEATIRSKFPFVKWINMGYNAGFARGNNAGIRAAESPVVLLLNPDTIINDEAIYKCYLRFINSDYAACSVQLLYQNGEPQITGSYFMKGGLNHLLPLPYLGKALQIATAPLRKKRTAVLKAQDEQKVDRLNGAFMMVKRNAIEKVGMFDEDFFIYSEEVEWCSRLKKAGAIVVYGDMNIIHIQGTSINAATNAVDKSYFDLYDKKGLQLIISRCVRIRKQFGVGWFFVHLLTNTFEIPVFLIGSIIHQAFALRNPFKEFGKIAGFTKNVMILWKLTPVIIRNKPYFYKMF